VFGVLGLVGFGAVLQSGGNWYLNVDDKNAAAAASGCYAAAGIYAAYVVLCSYRVCRMAAAKKNEDILLVDRRD